MRALLSVSAVLVAALAVWVFVGRSDAGRGATTVGPEGAVTAESSTREAELAVGLRPELDDRPERVVAVQEGAEESSTTLYGGPTREVVVAVTIQDSWKDDAPRSVGLGFVVGMTRDARHAEGPVGDHKLLLARGVSDANGEGHVVMQVPVAALEEWGDDARVWGHVAHPGKRSFVRTTRRAAGRGETPLKLFPRGGASIFGRVLRADGTPANPGEVQLFPAGTPEGEWVSNEDSAYLDAHGGFQLDADEAGTYDVQVTASGQGTAGLRGLSIEGTGEPEYVELVLSGDGVIAGVLLDPDGVPVPRYRMWCAPEQYRDEWVGYLHDPRRVPHEWGGGLFGDHRSTDEDGRFRFEGLQPGRYLIRGHTAKSGYYEEVLTERLVETGTLDLELKLARHRVLARVLDHEGKPVEVDQEHRPERDELPKHALYIEECDASGRLLKAERYSHETRPRLANGDLVLDVQPGKSYVLGVFSRECALVEQRFDVTPGDYEQVITVQLPPPAPGTVLEVELQTPGGEAYEGDNGQRLYAPDSGRLLWETSRYQDESTIRLAIGPGRYRWVADAEPTRGHHGERWSATPYAPVSDELVVLGGRVNQFERSLSPAGRLSLLVTSTRPATGAGALDEAAFERLDWLDQLRVQNGGAAVRLERNGEVLRPAFNLGRPSDIVGESITLHNLEGPWVVVGERMKTVDPIPPGRYRLVVELDGLGIRERTIDVRADDLTEVSVSFDD